MIRDWTTKTITKRQLTALRFIVGQEVIIKGRIRTLKLYINRLVKVQTRQHRDECNRRGFMSYLDRRREELRVLIKASAGFGKGTGGGKEVRTAKGMIAIVKILSEALPVTSGKFLQRAHEVLTGRLQRVFIPKVGTVNGLRPLGCPAHVDKVIEYFMAPSLNDVLRRYILSLDNRNLHIRGYLSRTSPHEIVEIIDRMLPELSVKVVAMLDQSGAFDSAKPLAIRQTLDELYPDNPGLVTLMCDLAGRQIQSDFAQVLKDQSRKEWNGTVQALNDGQVTIYLKAPNRAQITVNGYGTPQGGVLSPLIFLAVYAKALEKAMGKFPEATYFGYADDGLICTPNDDAHEIMDEIARVCKRIGLQINKQKTEYEENTAKLLGFKWTREPESRKWTMGLDATHIQSRDKRSHKQLIRHSSGLYRPAILKVLGGDWNLVEMYSSYLNLAMTYPDLSEKEMQRVIEAIQTFIRASITTEEEALNDKFVRSLAWLEEGMSVNLGLYNSIVAHLGKLRYYNPRLSKAIKESGIQSYIRAVKGATQQHGILRKDETIVTRETTLLERIEGKGLTVEEVTSRTWKIEPPSPIRTEWGKRMYKKLSSQSVKQDRIGIQSVEESYNELLKARKYRRWYEVLATGSDDEKWNKAQATLMLEMWKQYVLKLSKETGNMCPTIDYVITISDESQRAWLTLADKGERPETSPRLTDNVKEAGRLLRLKPRATLKRVVKACNNSGQPSPQRSLSKDL